MKQWMSLKLRAGRPVFIKINPETLDAQLLETVTTMAIGGSLDAYIDFADEFLNGNMKATDNDDNSKYGYYSYFMEKFPYANIRK